MEVGNKRWLGREKGAKNKPPLIRKRRGVVQGADVPSTLPKKGGPDVQKETQLVRNDPAGDKKKVQAKQRSPEERLKKVG